ncbi:MAG: ShlB/FhaC/HecB family hemolysin secretion/activation protein [Alphaproteobacteria bacterium]|nr:ShlB/FhaC/HecB family hemolysin secretion/activation protein [Alphaproteobacteria bacterium]
MRVPMSLELMRKNNLLKYGFVIAMCITYAPSAYAQVEEATGTADPSRIEQELLGINQLPELTQKKVEVENLDLQNAPPGAEDIKFQLQSLSIEGVGIYTSEDLNTIYSDKIGTVISLKDLYGIANAITNKYRNDGYILTQVIVPPQTIEGGDVKLRAVEGFIDNIIIEGEGSESEQKQIRKYAENLRKNNILSAQALERNLLLINDLPGVRARSVLSPSKSKTGGSDLTIIVERDSYEGEASVDNHGSRFLGPYQGAITGTANSAFGLNERITTQLVTAGDKDNKDELLFGSVLYEMPVNQFGTLLRMIGSISATEPGDDLEDFDVNGISRFASASVVHPFVRSRTENLTARAGFDIRNVDSRNNLSPSTHDAIRSVRVGATYQFLDTFIGVGFNVFDFEVSQGVDILGASGSGDSDLTRAAGDPLYTKARLQLQRLQRITSNVNILFAGQGQLAASPLLSSEEFGVGGVNIGRGYDSSEIVGDDGIAGKVEVQWNEPYKVKYLYDYQMFAYLDGGRVWDQDATTSGAKRESIVSTGVGFRTDFTEQTSAGFGVAFPLTRRVDTVNDRDPRYYFNITHKF